MSARQRQKLEIARLLRKGGPLTRPDVGSTLGLPLPTVSTLTKELIGTGLIVQDGHGPSAGGRRAALININPAYARAVGLEISLSFGVRAVLADFCGGVLDEEGDHDAAPEDLMDAAVAAVKKLLSRNADANLAGIGVAISGLVDSEAGISREFPRIQSWKDVPVAAILAEQFKGLAVAVENDVRCETLAVLRCGVGRGLSDFVFLHIGHGIAAGIVADGELYRGATGNAGEFGHVPTEKDGPICYCGSRGCLESVAGSLAVVEGVRNALSQGVHSTIDSEDVTPESIQAAAEQGDRLATTLLEQSADYLGSAAAGLVNLLNPEALILGGLLGKEGGVFRSALEKSLAARILPLLKDTTEVRNSTLGPEAAARGAAALIFERMYNEAELLFGG